MHASALKNIGRALRNVYFAPTDDSDSHADGPEENSRHVCRSDVSLAALLDAAIAQQRSLAEQLLGTWTLVSHKAVRQDGSTFFPYGPNPHGVAIFDSGNRFIITVMRSDRPKYAIGLPSKGTAEENKQTAEGTMTYFGTYSVDEAARVIAIHVDASSFPNWSGTDQVREFAISGNQLILTGRALATGGHADVVWKRVQ
jgi:Lipocalin-like domain